MSERSTVREDELLGAQGDSAVPSRKISIPVSKAIELNESRRVEEVDS